MNLFVVYGKEIDSNVRDLLRACEETGHHALPVSISHISVAMGISDKFWIKGKIIKSLDACFLRSLGLASYELMRRRLDLMEHLELSGVFVINPVEAFERAKDKYASLCTLARANVRVPKTVVTESSTFAYHFFKRRTPFVYKPMIGSMGFGSSKFDDVDVAYNVLHLLERSGKPLYLQEYLRTQGRDVRAFVIGDEVVASVERKAKKDSWKTNIAQGGEAVKIRLSPDVEEMAIKACKALKLEYGGVDLATGPDGVYVLEVNSSPSWKGIRMASGIDVAKLLVKHVEGRVKR